MPNDTRTHAIRAKTYARIALCAVLIAIGSWISVPTAVPFTLQTFAIFLTLFLLGGKGGLIAVCVYLALGALGVPVFSGFRAGIGALMGATGGYIAGFVVMAAVYRLVTHIFGEGALPTLAGALLGLIALYAFGTVWFLRVYASGGGMPLSRALALCVTPFIPADIVKLALAWLFAKRLKRILPTS